jgi:hypothetical protein
MAKQPLEITSLRRLSQRAARGGWERHLHLGRPEAALSPASHALVVLPLVHPTTCGAAPDRLPVQRAQRLHSDVHMPRAPARAEGAHGELSTAPGGASSVH